MFLCVELLLIKCLLLLYIEGNHHSFQNSCYLMVSNIHSKTLKHKLGLHNKIIFFCIVLKDSYILKCLWTFASPHSKYSPMQNPKISVWLVLKNSFKIKGNKVTDIWSSKRQGKLKINPGTLPYLQMNAVSY